MQRPQQKGSTADPVGQRRAVEHDTLPGIDLGLAIERQVIGVFGDEDLGHGRLGWQSALDQPTDQDGEIYRVAAGLLERAWKAGRPVRLVGVAVAQLGPKLRQLALFDRTWQADEKLLAAIDSIRNRYGADALRRGRANRRRTE